MLIANKVRIYPTDEQIRQMIKTIGCSRYVYNYFLDAWNKQYDKTGKGLSYQECSTMLTELKKSTLWLKEADATALQSSLRFLSDGFTAFFEKRAEHPVFHKKGNSGAYTSKKNNDSIRIENKNHIRLPKIGAVYARGLRTFDGKILSATVAMAPTGKWFVSILYDG